MRIVVAALLLTRAAQLRAGGLFQCARLARTRAGGRAMPAQEAVALRQDEIKPLPCRQC